MTPADVLSRIADLRKVAITEPALAAELGIAGDDADGLAELGRHLSALKDSGEICRWATRARKGKEGKPDRPGKRIVTLSSIAAYRLRLRLNTSSSRWVEHGTEDEPDRNRARRTRSESGEVVKIMCESDMSEEPPGMLANVIDRRTEIDDDPDDDTVAALKDEKRLGLRRPTLALVGCQPWTAGNWERAPDAHVCDPLDDPRRPSDPGDGKARRRMTPDRLRSVRPAAVDCPVCNGRPLRALIGLLPMKVGKNRATEPPKLVDGGEFCAKCSRHWLDEYWPRVSRIGGPKANGKAIEKADQ